jgi:hypothetical protein
MKTEQLTAEEKHVIALEAIVNWCWNTQTHLNEARLLKSHKERRSMGGRQGRNWIRLTSFLIEKIQKELAKAEVDMMEELGTWPIILPDEFLNAIPEET